MDLLEAHGRAMVEFDRHVHEIRPDQWDAPTPCTEWAVRDVVNHLVSEQRWVPPLLAGATVAELGDRFDGDQLDGDPVGRWERAAAEARAAWRSLPDLDHPIHLGRGPTPARDYCWEMVLDLAVHGWDLARGIGADDTIDPDLAQAAYDYAEPRVRGWASPLFAPPVPVPPDAGPQQQLLALLGRQP